MIGGSLAIQTSSRRDRRHLRWRDAIGLPAPQAASRRRIHQHPTSEARCKLKEKQRRKSKHTRKRPGPRVKGENNKKKNSHKLGEYLAFLAAAAPIHQLDEWRNLARDGSINVRAGSVFEGGRVRTCFAGKPLPGAPFPGAERESQPLSWKGWTEAFRFRTFLKPTRGRVIAAMGARKIVLEI